ncbi:hypothetical protein CMALT394_10131 [Carnobacterium maltaromaticum]|nr:hypothetical protein CMALT394_10131 [Carnobacterium maltaromaticum]
MQFSVDVTINLNKHFLTNCKLIKDVTERTPECTSVHEEWSKGNRRRVAP